MLAKVLERSLARRKVLPLDFSAITIFNHWREATHFGTSEPFNLRCRITTKLSTNEGKFRTPPQKSQEPPTVTAIFALTACNDTESGLLNPYERIAKRRKENPDGTSQ